MCAATPFTSVLLALLVGGCATAFDGEPPLPLAPTNVNYTQTVTYAPTVMQPPPAPPAPVTAASPASEPPETTDWRRVVILQTSHLDRPAEVLGIVDVHEAMGMHQQALDEMKQMAARIGADAVVGVEFHHGEGHGAEPTHLSGLAVRYLSKPL